jgi:hypothetical protein
MTDDALIATIALDEWLSLKARIRELEAALTPSAETKAAYMGEFTLDFPEMGEDGEERMRRINVPWTTIKTIMAAIHARACSPLSDATQDREAEPRP